MSRSARVGSAWTGEDAARQITTLVNRWKRLEAIKDLEASATDAETIAKVNEILRALRSVTRGTG